MDDALTRALPDTQRDALRETVAQLRALDLAAVEDRLVKAGAALCDLHPSGNGGRGFSSVVAASLADIDDFLAALRGIGAPDS